MEQEAMMNPMSIIANVRAITRGFVSFYYTFKLRIVLERCNTKRFSGMVRLDR